MSKTPSYQISAMEAAIELIVVADPYADSQTVRVSDFQSMVVTRTELHTLTYWARGEHTTDRIRVDTVQISSPTQTVMRVDELSTKDGVILG